MSDIAIRVENYILSADLWSGVEGLSKRYHLGRAQQRHDTLRDALVAVFSRQSSVVSRQARLANDNSELKTDNSLLWALRDISFEVKQGEVVGTLAPAVCPQGKCRCHRPQRRGEVHPVQDPLAHHRAANPCFESVCGIICMSSSQ